MEAEGDGVLGNLPSSRPGRRSEKRSSGARRGRPAGPPAASARRAAEDAERRGSAAAVTPRDETPPPLSRGPSRKGGGPVGDAVRGAAQLTGAPLRIGVILTREVLRRLPRP